MKPENIVGIKEIAERAGVVPITVHKWRERPVGFPQPAVHLSMGPVWDWTKVARWIERRQK